MKPGPQREPRGARLGRAIARALSPTTWVDAAVGVFSPVRKLRNLQARAVLARYEGGRSTKRHKKSRDNSSGERHVVRDAATVRATIRDLERNFDLVAGAIQSWAVRVVGANGIDVSPQPRKNDSGPAFDSIDDDFARYLLGKWRVWCQSPEVTRTMDWAGVCQLAAATWGRDGELFGQHVEGTNAFIRHATAIPYSIELLEADVVPLDHAPAENIDAGIKRNAWGEPVSYFMHKKHPGNGNGYVANDLKEVPASKVFHLPHRTRWSGLRGISIFAPCIDRLLDCKGYEADEQTAARIAARVVAYIKRDVNMQWTPPAQTDENGEPKDREFLLDPGALFTDTLPGEELELLNPNRPNSNLDAFRRALVRAASRPTMLSYSTFSGDYDGTYSAQRQELVESDLGLKMFTRQFIARFVRPIWERWVQMGIASGEIKVPANIRPETVAQAEFRGPAMPWIDPVKEANALRALARSGHESLTRQIAERGGRMQDVFEEIHRERELAEELGLILDSDARYTSGSGVTQARPGESAYPGGESGNDDEAGARTRTRAARSRANGHHGEPH